MKLTIPHKIRLVTLSLPVIGSVLLIAGCQKDEPTPISPQYGDTRSYQVTSQITVNIPTQSNTPQFSTMGNVSFKITDSNDKQINVEVVNHYAEFQGPQFYFSSDTSTNDGKNQWQSIMAKGFTVAVDKKSGQLINFKAHDQTTWRQLVNDGNQAWLLPLRNQSWVPYLMERIPTEIGKQIDLPKYQGVKATLTVEAVNDEYIIASIKSGTKNTTLGLSARAVIERDSGWLSSLSCITKQPYKQHSQTGVVTTHIRMISDKPAFIPSPDADDIFTSQPPSTTMNAATFVDIDSRQESPIKEGSLSANKIGTYTVSHQGINLVYSAVTENGQLVGDFFLNQLQGLDENNRPVKQGLWVANHHVDTDTNGINLANFDVRFTGWNNPKHEPIKAIQGVLTFQPRHIVSKQVELLKGEQQSFELDGLTVNVLPIPRQYGHYLVSTTDKPGRILKHHVGGILGKIAPNISQTRAKTLLNDAYKNYGDAPHIDGNMTNFEFIANNEPHTVTFYVLHDDKNIQTQAVRFIPYDSYISNAKNRPLFENIEQQSKVESAREQSFSIKQLKPEPFRVYGLKLTLPEEVLATCQIGLTNGFSINNHPVKWIDAQQLSQMKGSKAPEPSTNRTFYLSTNDGVQQFFYDQKITTEMNCHERLVWVPFTPNVVANKQWLVDITQLGNNIKTMKIKDFMKKYRFLNKQKETLGLYDAQKARPVGLNSNARLSSILTDEGELRLSGLVESAARITRKPFKFHQQWHYTFPSLPIPMEQ